MQCMACGMGYQSVILNFLKTITAPSPQELLALIQTSGWLLRGAIQISKYRGV